MKQEIHFFAHFWCAIRAFGMASPGDDFSALCAFLEIPASRTNTANVLLTITALFRASCFALRAVRARD